MISGTFYTIGEVAGQLQKNRLTIRNWIRAGKLSATRVGNAALIREEDISHLLIKLAGRTDFRRRFDERRNSPARNPKVPLGTRATAVLAYLREYVADNPFPPTISEIQTGCQLSSTSVATYQLDILEQRGLITRHRNSARGIRLTQTSEGRHKEFEN